MTIVRCECGGWSGEMCQWMGPEADTVIVEYMPEILRRSHSLSRNQGFFPNNGAIRLRCERSCAKLILQSSGDEWSRIIKEEDL